MKNENVFSIGLLSRSFLLQIKKAEQYAPPLLIIFYHRTHETHGKLRSKFRVFCVFRSSIIFVVNYYFRK